MFKDKRLCLETKIGIYFYKYKNQNVKVGLTEKN